MVSNIDEALRRRGRRRRIGLGVAGFEMLPALMRGSSLIASLPERLSAGAMRGFGYVTPPLKIAPAPIYAVWSARKHGDPAHRWLREEIWRVVKRETAG